MNFELFNLGPDSIGYPPETKRIYLVVKVGHQDWSLKLVVKVGRQGWSPLLVANVGRQGRSSRLLSLHHLAYLMRQGVFFMGRVDTSFLESVFNI